MTTDISRRRVVREKVLQVLFAHELSHEPLPFIEEQQLEGLKEHRVEYDFARALIHAADSHAAEIDELIIARVSHWEFGRLAVVDKVALRAGVAELLYFPDIPPKVTINEAIELVKKFSTEKSGDFVNGVLDSIYAELKKAKRIEKTGRGLNEG
jgi:N utilization substance protein B